MPNFNYLNKEKKLYQFGDGMGEYFIFNSVELNITPENTLKTNFLDNQGIDGAIKLNGDDRFKKTSTQYRIEGILQDTDYYDVDYYYRVFFEGGRKIAFFYDIDKDGYVQFYFTYLTVVDVKILQNKSTESINQQAKRVNITLSADYPYMWKCTNNIAYFDRDAFSISQPTYNDGVTQYNDGITTYNQALLVASVPISNLTLDQRQEYFVNATGNQRNKSLIYVDRFIAREVLSIDSTNLIINYTLVTNTPYYQQITDKLNDSSAPNNKYIIEIGQMIQNDDLEILNQTNNTGLSFEWLSASSSPAMIIFNSDSGRAYNPSTGAVIPTTDIRIGRVGDGFLEFMPKRTLNKVLNDQIDTLRLTKTTSGSLTLKIECLTTYN